MYIITFPFFLLLLFYFLFTFLIFYLLFSFSLSFLCFPFSPPPPSPPLPPPRKCARWLSVVSKCGGHSSSSTLAGHLSLYRARRPPPPLSLGSAASTSLPRLRHHHLQHCHPATSRCTMPSPALRLSPPPLPHTREAETTFISLQL